MFKIPRPTQGPLLFVIFASPNVPYFENRGGTPASASVLYGSPALTEQATFQFGSLNQTTTTGTL